MNKLDFIEELCATFGQPAGNRTDKQIAHYKAIIADTASKYQSEALEKALVKLRSTDRGQYASRFPAHDEINRALNNSVKIPANKQLGPSDAKIFDYLRNTPHGQKAMHDGYANDLYILCIQTGTLPPQHEAEAQGRKTLEARRWIRDNSERIGLCEALPSNLQTFLNPEKREEDFQRKVKHA